MLDRHASFYLDAEQLSILPITFVTHLQWLSAYITGIKTILKKKKKKPLNQLKNIIIT